MSVTDSTSYATLTGQDGSRSTFAVAGTGGSGQTAYTPQGPANTAGLHMSKASGMFVLTDSDGVVTAFSAPAGATAGTYLPVTVTQPGGGNTTAGYVYDASSTDAAYGKPVLVVAPDPDAPAGTPGTAACPNPPSAGTWDAGCRALKLIYDPATKNVSEVDFLTSDSTRLIQTPVAQYSYDASGRLTAQWDPRISPALKTTYGYDETSGDADYGRLTQISPAQSAPGRPRSLESGLQRHRR